MDPAWLEKEAVRALGRHEKSRAGLTLAVERAVERRRQRTGEQPPSDLLSALPRILDGLEARGHLDDRRFAEGLLRRYASRGYPRARLEAELRHRGVESDLIRELLPANADAADLAAAWRYAKKKRIGPYCLDPEKRERDRNRHEAMLGRAGFSFEMAREILSASECPSPEALGALAHDE